MLQKHTSIQNLQYFFACIFFASLNFEVFSPLVPDFSIAKMTALMYMGVSLLTPLGDLFNYKRIQFGLISAIFMMVTMVTSSVIHQNERFFDTTMLLNFIMMWLLINHARRDGRVFNEGLVWFAISSGIVGVFFMMGIGVGYEHGVRLTMFGDNENETGIKMASSILYLLNYCLNHSGEKKGVKIWLLLLIYPMLNLMFAVASRTALIILVLGLFVFILLYPIKKRSFKFGVLLIGVFVMWKGWQYLQMQEVILMRMTSTVEEGNMSQREVIWATYIRLIEKHPIIGLGFTGWHSFSMERFYLVRSPHNVIIEVLLISGIIGLFFFLLLLFSIYKNAYLYYRKENNMAPLLLSITILALVLSGQALGVKLFWTIAAYCISYKVIKNPKSGDIKSIVKKELIPNDQTI